MKRKTSKFIGVWFHQKRRRWIVDVKVAKFWRQYYTEAEAVAHYNAIARFQWDLPPEQLNNLWKIRPNVGFLGTGPGALRVIDIDQNELTLVDEHIYAQCKDWDWFIDWHTGRVTVITHYFPEAPEPKDRFQYTTLEEFVLGVPARHLDGNPLDNRRLNLIPDDHPGGYIYHPGRRLWEVQHFETLLEKRREFERAEKVGRKKVWAGPEPRDPRTGFPNWQEWLHALKPPLPPVTG